MTRDDFIQMMVIVAEETNVKVIDWEGIIFNYEDYKAGRECLKGANQHEA